MTDAVKHLLIINVLMFVGAITIGSQGELFSNLFGLHFPLNDTFKPWQILTHMFMHATYVPTTTGATIYFQHILFNMLALWMFGTAVEQVFGTKKFVIFYLLAGLGAAVLQLTYLYFKFNSGFDALVVAGYDTTDIMNTLNEGKKYNNWENILGVEGYKGFMRSFHSTMVGASGAIMGVLVAFGMLFPNSKLMLIFLPVPVKAKYFIPVIIGLDLISALTGHSFLSPNNTAYVAHLGGALTGFLMVYFWKKDQFDGYRWN